MVNDKWLPDKKQRQQEMIHTHVTKPWWFFYLCQALTAYDLHKSGKKMFMFFNLITISNSHFSIVYGKPNFYMCDVHMSSILGQKKASWGGSWHKWGRTDPHDESWWGSPKEKDVRVYGRMMMMMIIIIKSRNWKWNSGSTRPGVTNKILRDKNIEHRDR